MKEIQHWFRTFCSVFALICNGCIVTDEQILQPNCSTDFFSSLTSYGAIPTGCRDLSLHPAIAVVACVLAGWRPKGAESAEGRCRAEFVLFSPKAELLQDKRVGTERRKEGGVEDLLRGSSATRKLECASETLRTHTHSCITVRVCVRVSERRNCTERRARSHRQ